MNRVCRKAALMTLLLLVAGMARAQYVTEVFLTDISNTTAKEGAQQNITKLLTALNQAEATGAVVDFSGIVIEERAQKAITDMWQNTAPFRCGGTEVIERCLHTHDGNYQVRNIPLFFKRPEAEKDEYQEGVISFNAKGEIVDFHLAIASNLYVKVLKKGFDVTDLRYRQMILDYVEQFRTAYNTKDLPFLEQIYSDDALIITGKVIKSAPTEMNNFLPKDKVKYTKQTKKEYLKGLSRVFKANQHINCIFDDIKVMKHPAKEGYYGVTLKQGWNADNYSDVGYLFLLWDFTNPDAPQIHVRTWQPEYKDINKTEPLPEEEIFTCDDFDIE